MPFNLVDLIVAVPLAAMFIKGMKNGFAHEIISLVGQIAAIFLAFTYMEQLGQAIIKLFQLAWTGRSPRRISDYLSYFCPVGPADH